MSKPDEKRKTRHLPGGDLESPLLDAEFFTNEDKSGREARLDALESESPFLQAFEGNLRVTPDPEIDEEDTAWQEPEIENFGEQADEPDFEEETFGDDARTLVRDAFEIPNRWICALDILSDNPESHSRATGILIGPRYVLTAKHILDDTSNELYVSPARNGNNSDNPFGKFKAKEFKFPEPYDINLPVQHGKFAGTQTKIPQNDDYMLIILKEDLASITHPTRGVLGYWGQNPAKAAVRILEPEAIQSKEISVIGYPGDTCGEIKFSSAASQKTRNIKKCLRERAYEWASRQWLSTGVLDVKTIFPSRMYHTADTYRGESGAPIWLKMGATLNLVGIHLDVEFKSAQRNLGLRVTERMLRNLCAWINKDAGHAIASIKDNALIIQWVPENASKTRPIEQRIMFQIPYRWISRLEIYDNDLRRVVGYGTGLLISDRHILTSSRVIYGFSKDRRKYSIRITPGYEFGKETFGSATASRARVSPEFSSESKDGSVDFGLLTLSRPLGSTTFTAIGNAALGSWGESSHGFSTSTADLDHKIAHIAAFSRSSGGGSGYHRLSVSSGRIIGIQRGQILHKASSRLDAPGAPIWIESGGRRLLVGITSSIFSKDSGTNWGCYLSQETRALLSQWIKEDHGKSDLEAEDEFNQEEIESIQASKDLEFEDNTDEMYNEPEFQEEYPEAESNADSLHDADEDWFAQSPDDSLATTEGDLAANTEAESRADKLSTASEQGIEEEENLEWGNPLEQGTEGLTAPQDQDLQTQDAMLNPDHPFAESWTGESADYEMTGGPYDSVHLEHQTGSVASVVDPFPRYAYRLGLEMTIEMTNKKFWDCVVPVEKDADTSPMCGAIVDITGKPELPPFFAHNPMDMVYVGSLAKIYPMYVAFELRKLVRQQAMDTIRDMKRAGLSTDRPGWERQVFSKIENLWKPKLIAEFRRAFPGHPLDFPKLGQIFDIAPDGRVDFARATPTLTDLDLDRIGEFGNPKGKFWDWMRLMLRWSNNEAASKCILPLSYPYINAVLDKAGFFNRSEKIGLWISGDYAGNDWLPRDRAGQRLSPRWARLQGRKVTNFAGTAIQVARLLTLLAQDRLIDKESSREMREIMTGVVGIGSYISGGLAQPRPPPLPPRVKLTEAITFADHMPPPTSCQIASKIGFGNDGFSHDCAIVWMNRGVDPARRLCYVVVALGSPPNKARSDLRELVVRFHDCVVARHP